MSIVLQRVCVEVLKPVDTGAAWSFMHSQCRVREECVPTEAPKAVSPGYVFLNYSPGVVFAFPFTLSLNLNNNNNSNKLTLFWGAQNIIACTAFHLDRET